MPKFTVEWEDIGEGMSGDYEPTDPNDVPLLRFYVLDANGEQIPNGSYCTLIPVGTEQSKLDTFSARILDAVGDGSSYKRKLEELTWTKVSDL